MMHLPETLIDKLKTIKGFREKPFIKAHSEAPVISLRRHPVKGRSLSVSGTEVPWCEQGIYLPERPVFTLDPVFHAGGYYVQEASSMFLEQFIQSFTIEKKDLKVLDLCAAPGGKSTHLVSLLSPESLLISNEVIRSRAAVLEENAVRWGYVNHWVCANDPRDFSVLKGYFDLVVVDAPCSGSGLFRRDEEALNSWSENNVQHCSQRQRRILHDVWDALKEQGWLVYATCSYSPEEDEAILDWLSLNFDVQPVAITVPESWGITTILSEQGLTGYRFFPDQLQGEGFFIAAIQKKQMTPAIHLHGRKKKTPNKLPQNATDLLSKEVEFAFQQRKDSVTAIAQVHEPDLELLQQQLFFRKVGVSLGMPAGKEWIPSHDLAMSIHKTKELPALSLSRHQALKFLRREEMELTVVDKGWKLAVFEGLALGWVKVVPGRVNNYLPRHWRIRMELPGEKNQKRL